MKEPINIFISLDLENYISSNIIEENIIIRGEQIKKLDGIKTIDGFLGICDSSIENLGELVEVKGDFWTSFNTIASPLKSLNKLEKIGGDALMRYSNINDLGNLSYVGGKLSLRDTKIKNLGKLKYVGGDLFLPMHLKDSIDLSNIEIIGKIQYWNDKKNRTEIFEKENLGLSKAELNVPYWKNQYIYSSEEIRNANQEQKSFYSYFKKNFENNKFIDLEGNHNYSFILYYDLLSQYYNHRHIDKLQNQFSKIEKYYPKTGNYISLSIIQVFEKNEDFESAWGFINKRGYVSLKTVWEYQNKLKRRTLNGDLISKLAGFSHLTLFGQNNIENIKKYIIEYLETYEKENNSTFFKIFFDDKQLFKLTNSNDYSPQYYSKYYLSEREYNYYKEIDDNQEKSGYKNTGLKLVVEKAILNQFRFIITKAEDIYREKIGMPKVGEGWISETELFYKITENYKELSVIHHGKPKWLGRQHIDIYFSELNIAIEYQGSQHYEPINFFGGIEAFERTKERDENKRKLCLENNCILIYVNEKYAFEEIKLEIQQAINKQTTPPLAMASRS
ncbi:hypothetical protein ACFX5D_15800 [Flavobacterium sp. LB3P45]|uniref:Leucine rich repeat-containing protein n=1 Tax=Flavobacterium fructosi TaxID=3230416 RepID=A0ABW6HQT4_9FLAO